MKHQMYIVDFTFDGKEWQSDVIAFKEKGSAIERAQLLPTIYNRSDKRITYEIVTLTLIKTTDLNM